MLQKIGGDQYNHEVLTEDRIGETSNSIWWMYWEFDLLGSTYNILHSSLSHFSCPLLGVQEFLLPRHSCGFLVLIPFYHSSWPRFWSPKHHIENRYVQWWPQHPGIYRRCILKRWKGQKSLSAPRLFQKSWWYNMWSEHGNKKISFDTKRTLKED